VPVLLADPEAGLVGAVHAGWRGVLAGVAGRAVAELRGAGARKVGAVIGPAICGNCYEVSPDLVQRFAQAGLPASATSWGTSSLDLPALVAAQLEAAGVAQVARVDRCTLEDQALYSHRRQAAQAGRMAGFVAITRHAGLLTVFSLSRP
jgi:YfiH family protein